MADEQLRYDLMVEGALRRVVYDTMQLVAEHGLPGSHHFYISFLTEHPGVQIPNYLREQYPREMTIVMQYQYYGLVVNEQSFSATLSFNNVKERLTIPFAAITTFADPSVNFALQFQTLEEGEEGDEIISEAPGNDEKNAEKKSDENQEKGVVISLDQFRKKTVEKES